MGGVPVLVDFSVGEVHEIAESVWWEHQRFICPTARFRVVAGMNFLGSLFHFDELDTIPVPFVIFLNHAVEYCLTPNLPLLGRFLHAKVDTLHDSRHTLLCDAGVLVRHG